MIPPDLTMAKWRKSSHSGHDGGECVEIAAVNGQIAIRDSKAPAGPVLILERSAWIKLAGRVEIL
jgi:hypothetical protein